MLAFIINILLLLLLSNLLNCFVAQLFYILFANKNYFKKGFKAC